MKKENMNNKGFSLVELIIVIAIMAILIVVLAPQYLKYVEKSRNSTDMQNATEIVNAIQVYAADPDVTSNRFAAGTVKITADSSSVAADTQTTAFEAAMSNAGLDVGSKKCVSTTAWTAYTITMTVGADGDVSFTYSSTGGPSGAGDQFAAKMGNATPAGTP